MGRRRFFGAPRIKIASRTFQQTSPAVSCNKETVGF